MRNRKGQDMTEETKELTDEQKKFAIIKTLDGWRWDINPNDVLEGYKSYSFGEDLKECFDDEGKIKDNKLTPGLAEKVLLTHHLLYICNRQTGARRIFSEGAKVISNIVENYYEDKENFDFNKYIKNKNDKKQETDTTDTETDEQKNKDSYYLEFDNKQFASRYMLTDIACMQKTLINLNGSEAYFKNIRSIDNKNKNYENFSTFLKEFSSDIRTLAQALYELTYQGVPVIRNSDVENEVDKMDEIEKLLSENVENKVLTKVRKQLSSSYKFEKKKHNLKRVWCEVRDFLYDPVLQECFKIIVGKEFNAPEEEYDVSYLELPGDVWNNNSTFAKCFWGKTYGNSSKFVRTQFDNDSKNGKDLNCWGGCYPHHFDITFNFVPRMCESNNCSMCPICKDKNENEKIKNEDWKKLCHKKEGNYCSFALYATGVKHVCNGEKDCKILNPTTTP